MYYANSRETYFSRGVPERYPARDHCPARPAREIFRLEPANPALSQSDLAKKPCRFNEKSN